jgi:hypothetical protein
MCDFITFMFLESTKNPQFGVIFIIRHAVDYLLGLLPKPASMKSIDDIKSVSSSSLSSTRNINKKMKPRPSLIWQANPLVVFINGALRRNRC